MLNAMFAVSFNINCNVMVGVAKVCIMNATIQTSNNVEQGRK